jgi:hypothetical protein
MYLIASEEPATLKDKAKWSDEFKSFVATCLKKEPADRPAAKDLLKVCPVEDRPARRARELFTDNGNLL